jgi:carbonic anhydrase
MTDRLLKGFEERFLPKAYNSDGALMPELVEYGQKPDYMIISCADSRSDPGIIFDAHPGVFFGFKAIGAIVRPYKPGTALAASLQFALHYLKIPKLYLLGHTHCGAVKALHDETVDPDLAGFMNVMHNAMDKAREITGEEADEETVLREAERQVLELSAENLLGYPAVEEALNENRLKIELLIFDMEHGSILRYDPKTGDYAPATKDIVKRSGGCNDSSCACG